MTLRRVFSGFSEEWSEVQQSSTRHVLHRPFSLFHSLSLTYAHGVAVPNKGKCPGLHLSDCFPEITLFPQIPLPIPSATKFILFFVISVNELEAQYPSIGVLSFPTPPFPWRILTFVKTYRHRTLSESHSTTYFNLDHIDPRLVCGEGVIKSALEWFLPLPCHRGACHPQGDGQTGRWSWGIKELESS